MLKELWTKIPLGLRQSFITIFGNGFSTFFSALALILISRWLGPTQFGEFSVGFAIVQMLSRLNDLGFSTILLKYLPRYEDHNHQTELINFSILVKVVAYVIILGLGMLVSPWLTAVLHFSQPMIIFLAFFTVIASVFYEQLLYTLQALHRFFQAISVNAIQSITKMLIVLLFMVLGLRNSQHYFFMYMMVPLVPVLLAFKLMPRWYHFSLKTNFNKYLDVTLKLAPHAATAYIIAGIVENIDILFVQSYLNAYDVGLLSGITRISMFILLLGYSLGNVLYPRVAKYQQKNDMKKYLIKAGAISLVCMVSSLVFMPFSGLLTRFTIGPEYLSGVQLLNILVFSSFLTVASIPFIAVFYAFENPWLFSLSSLGQLLIILVGNMEFVPSMGLEGAVYTKLVSRIFLFGFSWIAAIILYRKHHVVVKN